VAVLSEDAGSFCRRRRRRREELVDSSRRLEFRDSGQALLLEEGFGRLECWSCSEERVQR